MDNIKQEELKKAYKKEKNHRIRARMVAVRIVQVRNMSVEKAARLQVRCSTRVCGRFAPLRRRKSPSSSRTRPCRSCTDVHTGTCATRPTKFCPADSSRCPFSRIPRKASWIWWEMRLRTHPRPYDMTPWALSAWPFTTTGIPI